MPIAMQSQYLAQIISPFYRTKNIWCEHSSSSKGHLIFGELLLLQSQEILLLHTLHSLVLWTRNTPNYHTESRTGTQFHGGRPVSCDIRKLSAPSHRFSLISYPSWEQTEIILKTPELKIYDKPYLFHNSK